MRYITGVIIIYYWPFQERNLTLNARHAKFKAAKNAMQGANNAVRNR